MADRDSSSLSDIKYDVEKGHGNDSDPHVAALVEQLEELDDPNLGKDALVLEDDSPYPEVRSAVANTDDPSMPCSTVRAWTIGFIFAIVMAALNQFFFFRYPSVTIGNVSPSMPAHSR